MVITSAIKNKTRILEKKITSLEKKISKIQNNLYEAQLDFYYLSSPQVISKKIAKYTDNEYISIKYSNIYFSLEQFLNEQIKITKNLIDEKKTKAK